MNKTIIAIEETTKDAKVLKYADMLLANRNRLFKAVFRKADDSIREMKFSVGIGWNALNGIKTTKSGFKMVGTKVARDIATVTEFLGDGQFQPRSLPLARIISLEVL